MFHVPEKYRVTTGLMASSTLDGNNGLFVFALGNFKKKPFIISCIASDGLGWEHVSVSTNLGTPFWEVMQRVKDLFWDEEDCVIQFHPPKSVYVNNHPFVLHLWRQVGVNYQTPPTELVGVLIS